MSEKNRPLDVTPDVTGSDEPETTAKPANKRTRRLAFVALYVVVFIFAIYAVVTLVGLHSQIQERRAELEELQGEITVQEIKNDEMSKLYNYTDDEFSDYVEQIARDDLDYVKSGERVFVNVSGD